MKPSGPKWDIIYHRGTAFTDTLGKICSGTIFRISIVLSNLIKSEEIGPGENQLVQHYLNFLKLKHVDAVNKVRK